MFIMNSKKPPNTCSFLLYWSSRYFPAVHLYDKRKWLHWIPSSAPSQPSPKSQRFFGAWSPGISRFLAFWNHHMLKQYSNNVKTKNCSQPRLVSFEVPSATQRTSHKHWPLRSGWFRHIGCCCASVERVRQPETRTWHTRLVSWSPFVWFCP